LCGSDLENYVNLACSLAKIQKAVLVEKRRLYRSTNPPYDKRGYVVDFLGKEYNISLPADVSDNDLMLLVKDTDWTTWPEWTVFDQNNVENSEGMELDLLERAMLKMSEPERLKALLLYEVYIDHGEKGLEIAEDLMDESSTRDSTFSEDDFRKELAEKLDRANTGAK
jgi:hypothetical protein